MTKTVLITGASGFIGANLAYRLVRDGHRVHVFLRKGAKLWRLKNIQKEVIIHTVDISDRAKVFQALKKIRPHWIFHLAVYGAYSSQNDFQKMLKTNIYGTTNLVEAALQNKFEAFINIGSSSEYGLKTHAPSEKEWLDPNSHYALTKAFAAQYVRHVAISQKRPMITLRPYSVYGPLEEPTRFIPTLIIKAMKQKLPPLVSASVARDFIYIDDFVDAMVQSARKASRFRGSVYNVGTGHQTTIKEVVDFVVKKFRMQVQPKYQSMKNRRWDTDVWIANNRLIKKELKFKIKTDFKQGLAKTIEWFNTEPEFLKYYQKIIV